MFIGFLLILANIALVPVFLFFDGAIAQSCSTALSAIALAVVAFYMQPKEIDHLRPILPSAAIAALIPAAWMLLQTLPLGFLGIGHPIWSSASTALGSTLSASLSVDPGATLIAFGHYAGFVSLGLATSIVTIERRKAEWVLFALLAASTTIAIFVWARPSIVVDLSRSPFANGILPWIPTVLAIGSIVAVATAIRAYERSETRTKGPSSLILREAAQRLALGIAIFVLCATALIRVGQGYILAATAVALTIFAALALIRRLGFGVWATGAIGIALTAAAFALFTQSGIVRSSSPLLAFVDPGIVKGIGVVARMLADTRWSGSGAGTFAELMQLYGDIDAVSANTVALSTGAVITIELGRPALIFIEICVIILALVLLQATIKRGRDWFFPAAGIASIVILSIGAFGDTALLTPATATLTSVLVGLALAQTVGRSVKR